MLLLSGHDLEATHVECNLPTLRVSRTQATAGGNYLFIWLKVGADTKVWDRRLPNHRAEGNDVFRTAASSPRPDARQASGALAG